MKIIDYWGELYRISERGYVKFLRDGAADGNKGPEDFGGKLIGTIAFHAIDAKPSDFKEALEMLKGTPK